MKYSELVSATLANDKKRLNQIVDKLHSALVLYLCGTMQCSFTDAEDCSQQAILDTLEKIKANRIRTPDRVYLYLQKTCRNNYYRLVRHNNRMVSDEHFSYMIEPAVQLQNLLDDEKLGILNECLDKLSETLRTFIDYFISRPGIDSEQVAVEFNTSVAGVWSK
ncbi:MAG: hypothetical protein WD625_01840, partial [Balneolales bacterium]